VSRVCRDLYCNTRQTPAVCQAYRAEHDACTDTDKCAAGLDCAKGTCRKIASLVIGEECHGGQRVRARGCWRQLRGRWIGCFPLQSPRATR
jgi:hypothetical protein